MMKKRMKRIYSFLRYNSNKRLFINILLLSGFLRMSILLIPMKILMKYMGTLNEESKQEESEEAYQQAALISYAVDRVCKKTPWESKCLVRALAIQHFLKKKKISSTIYLGVGKDSADMIAHAWLRTGKFYISGGCGEGYALVAKFSS
ncbi:MAG: lasso peptide biosynthesis B2 protein [Mobilitalea sp.]